MVVATKVYGTMRKDPNGKGLSRKAIMTEVDGSLRRLGMDYIDLYQIHRWDYQTPIKETLEALHDVVKAGKATFRSCTKLSDNLALRWSPVTIRKHGQRSKKRRTFTYPRSFRAAATAAIFVQAIGEQIDSAPDFAVKRAVIKS